MNKVADIMLLNILFILFSLPIITIGASYTAAYYVALKMVRNEETYIFKSFWKSFKENFIQSTIMWVFIMIVAFVIVCDYRLILYSGMEFAQWIKIAVLAVTIIISLGVSYIFPLQSRYTNTIKNTVKNAFLTSILHLPTSIAIVVVYAIPLVILYFIEQALPLLFLLAFGLIIYGKAYLIRRIFDKLEENMQQPQEDIDESEQGSGIFAESDRLEKELQMEEKLEKGKNK
jgi:uncharacterized membrane protein YesL